MNFISLNIAYSLFSEYLVITDILKSKHIKDTAIFHCYNNDNFLILHKFLNTKLLEVSNRQFNKTKSYKMNSLYPRIGIVFDTSCPMWFEDLYSIEGIFFKGNTWIFKTDNFGFIVKRLAKFPFDVDSDVIIVTKSNGTSHYMIYDVFNTGFYTNGSFNVRKIGDWDSNIHLKQKIRTNLSGVVLKCIVVVIGQIEHQTFERYLEETRPPTVDSLHKLKFYRIFTYLQHMYNFSYEFRRTNSWGYLRNGSFDGMVGALQRGEMDIGGSPVFLRSDRAKFIDYVAQVWQTRPCFIFRNPKHPGGYSTIYTRPLTVSVWYSIIAVLVLVATMLCVMFKLKALQSAVDDLDSSTSLVVIFIVSAISQQGTATTRRSVSIKMVMFITLIFCLTLYQYYNGAVVSTLLREPARSIRDLEALLGSNLQVGVENVLYNKDFFKRTTDPVALELYKKKIVTESKKNFYDLERGMALVKRGGFAFHVDSVTAYRIMRKTFTERELCDAQEVQLYPPQDMAAVLKKGSPYREHVLIGIRRMFEAGLMLRLRRAWDEPRPACVPTPDSSVLSVSIHEFFMALAVLLVGTLFAVLVLIGEIFNSQYYNERIPYFN